jgi:gluconate 2-dehydrogenase gamma chain
MDSVELSRRSLLHALATAVAAMALPVGWADVAEAMQHARAGPVGGRNSSFWFLTPSEAADVEAIAAQIVPTDDTPGAREAGVVHFIDRALASFWSQLARDYRAQLGVFRSAVPERHPSAASFAALTSDQQIAHLRQYDRTPFFNTTRVLTLLGMFSLPAYGGNREGIGWKLIGFENAHIFQPPFGYYDRDYPGFVIDTRPVK